jgi:glycerol-3-phosphate dehydrogenase (NAD(P)+)
MSQVITQELGNVKIAVLSGPTIAREVAQFLPTTAVIACKNTKTALLLQHIFMSPRFRVYRHSDIVGVELGGSLKNIIAIACGISDGLGFGTNTKAALLSRGLAEICRLGIQLGANEKTFGGISGLGDLVTTCISASSRNRTVGEKLGKGMKVESIIRNMDMVAEGVYTVKAAYTLSKKYKVDMPITKEIYNVIYKNKPPVKAVNDLMSRGKKSEI